MDCTYDRSCQVIKLPMNKRYLVISAVIFIVGVIVTNVYNDLSYPVVKRDVTLEVEKCKAEADNTDLTEEYNKLRTAIESEDVLVKDYSEQDVMDMWNVWKAEKQGQIYKECLDTIQ